VGYRRDIVAFQVGLYVGVQLFLLLATQALAQEKREREGIEAWPNQSHDAQHTGTSSVRSQPLHKIRWQLPVDLNPQIDDGLFIHYGFTARYSREYRHCTG